VPVAPSVSGAKAAQGRADEAVLVAAAQAGDDNAFAALVERHRRELQLHCYRMLGSYQDAEDMVQETFLRAWRSLEGFSGGPGSSLRAWLYRIATNVCLDALKRSPRRVLASQLGPPADPTSPPLPVADLPWLQPYPDHLLEGIASGDDQPEAVVVARETIELAFLAAIQLLSPRQRAVLILRDVLGWSARETASLLEASVASVNSALQRARARLKEQRLPVRRLEWARSAEAGEEERAVLQRFMEAMEQTDVAAVAEVLREDVRANMPPYPFWYDGREANMTALAQGFDPASPYYLGQWRCVPTGANMQPAAAFYVRRPGDTAFRAFALDVLRIEDGKVAEITSFVDPDLFPAFGLPNTL
jgi:RNA polymerase sigma-70 factor, ECF subfamily